MSRRCRTASSSSGPASARSACAGTAKAGVAIHVHALRAAFAVQYLESNLGDTDALRELMGHARGETTQVYLRRLNRRRRMDSVRGLSGSPSAICGRNWWNPNQ